MCLINYEHICGVDFGDNNLSHENQSIGPKDITADIQTREMGQRFY